MQSPSPRSSSNVYYASLLAGPLIAGFAIYAILSYLFVPLRITVPLAITISILILGLSRYYDPNNSNNDKDGEKGATMTIASSTRGPDCLSNLDTELKLVQQRLREDRKEKNSNIDKRYYTISKKNFANIFFVLGYSSCLLIVTAYFFMFSPSNEETFVSWEQFTIVQIIELGASIALCFFLPGYAILEIIFRDSDHQIRPILKLLLAYLLSILVTGLTGYIIASVGFGLSNTVGLFIAVYLSILFVLIIRISSSHRNQKEIQKYFFRNLSLKKPTFDPLKHTVWNLFKGDNAGLIVFASLFALVILSTYFLYSGAIIGDQWYHHGRSLAFVSGEFRDISIAGADDKTFSPFPSALLAAFFSISGIPSVNAYASISFLNIIPVLAFYYFFKNSVPTRMKKSALLACTLFMLSSGFGWVYVLDLAVSNPPESQHSALEMMYQAGIKSIDIILPTSFVGTAHPDYSTPLIILALPAGLTMLGIIKEEIMKEKSKLTYFAILLSITFLGIISHDEFYLFIVIASIVPLFLFFICSRSRHEKKRNSIVVYGALLSALLLTVILAIYSFAGVGYFIYNTIIGIPLLVLCLLFTTAACMLYAIIRFFSRKTSFFPKNFTNSHFRFRTLLSKKWINYLNDHRNKTIATGLVVIIAWLYVFTFIVWGQLSVEDVEIQTLDYSIPWYLYPMKLGVTGLLGLAFVLSYLFRRFEKEVFVFGIIIVVSLVAGPYYDEHRFSKYVMAGLAGLASLFVYSFLVKSPQIQRYNRFRILANSFVLGIVVLSAALSILMFWGYNASAYDSDFEKALGRRDFPSASEFNLFRLLRNDSRDPLAFNVAAPANEYAFHTGDLIGKVHAFSGIPWPKLTQSPLSLNASTLEGFYDLLDYSDTRYIILPKEDYVNLTVVAKKDNEIETAIGGKQEREQGQPQQDTVISEEVRKGNISDVLHFAIENFQTVYEDGRYLVVAVPNLSHSRSQADIGFVFPRDELLSSSSYRTKVVLPYNKDLFKDIENLTRSNKLEIGTTSSILYGDKDETTTFWSNPISRGGDVNYIEATVRIIGENKTSNDAGILWDVGDKEYTLSVRNDRLEVLENPINVNNSEEALDKKLLNVREIDRMNGTWYTIKVILMEDYFDIYLNDIPVVQVPMINDEPYQPRNTSTSDPSNADIEDNTSISRTGIYAYNNVAEFKPIKIGQALLPLPNEEKSDFHHYYPLNMLATSKLGYDTFMEGDPSVFSKEVVVLDINSFLPSYSVTSTASNANLSSNIEDIKKDNQTNSKVRNSTSADRYLEYAKKGGTLVITNAVDHHDLFQSTELGKLFPIQAGDEVRFEKLAFNTEGKENQQKQNLNISGIATDIAVTNSSLYSDTKVVSSYLNGNNLEVAPFAIEKKYGDGRVIIVNSYGLFSAIASSPQQYFQKLADVPSLIGLDYTSQDSEKITHAQNAVLISRLVGDLNVSGHSIINSSSFSIIPNNGSEGVNDFASNKFYVQSLVAHDFSDKSSKEWILGHTIAKNRSMQDDNYSILNTVVKDLKLSGHYEVIMNLNGSFDLPANLPFASYYDYVAVSIQAGFDMIVRLQEGATAEFTLENDSIQQQQTLSFRDEGEIHFNNLSLHDKNEVYVLLKSPSIRVIDGKMHFEKLYMYHPNNLGKVTVNSASLNTSGAMIADINHVDHYDEVDSNGNWITTQYLTYIKSIQFAEGNLYNETKKINLDLPADVSVLAKEQGVTIPWQRALLSNTNIVISLLIVVAAVALTLTILQRPRWLGLKQM